jgi:hypothetical protein
VPQRSGDVIVRLSAQLLTCSVSDLHQQQRACENKNQLHLDIKREHESVIRRHRSTDAASSRVSPPTETREYEEL